jgi:hypothetical protein
MIFMVTRLKTPNLTPESLVPASTRGTPELPGRFNVLGGHFWRVYRSSQAQIVAIHLVSCPINNMAFARQLPDQLAVFQGGASRTGTSDEHI